MPVWLLYNARHTRRQEYCELQRGEPWRDASPSLAIGKHLVTGNDPLADAGCWTDQSDAIAYCGWRQGSRYVEFCSFILLFAFLDWPICVDTHLSRDHNRLSEPIRVISVCIDRHYSLLGRLRGGRPSHCPSSLCTRSKCTRHRLR